jgi:hypothetical protein
MTRSKKQKNEPWTYWIKKDFAKESRCLKRLTVLVALILMIVFVSLCFVPASDAQNATQAEIDSLIWDNEQLDADLKLCEIQSKQDKKALNIQLEFMGKRLEWAEEDRLRWYQKPALWFMVGATLGLLVAGWALTITY